MKDVNHCPLGMTDFSILIRSAMISHKRSPQALAVHVADWKMAGEGDDSFPQESSLALLLFSRMLPQLHTVIAGTGGQKLDWSGAPPMQPGQCYLYYSRDSQGYTKLLLSSPSTTFLEVAPINSLVYQASLGQNHCLALLLEPYLQWRGFF